MLYDVHHDAGQLASYRTDAAAYLSAVPLDDALRTAIRTNDIGAMYLAGANPYLLRAHCLGLHIPEPAFLASLRAVGAKESAHG
ncbi:subunit of meta cleavage enzyme [Roseateles chitinivorans]|uniref:subunit of meta cleavage enzyme n=1 Tax=Roseateles chitinivorans TaxID=2917965 RepID=UPI003D664CE5